MIFVLIGLGLASANPAFAEEALLAEDGHARMPIVLATSAAARERVLATELAKYLEEMGGAAFEITTGDGSRGIVLGTVDQFPVPEWREPLRVRGHDGREAYGIRTSQQRVLILGATVAGLDRGITKLLEALGCRWFFPSAAWRVVPKMGRLAVDFELTDRPALLSRVIWYGWGYWDAKAREDHREWQRRNWMGESLKIYCSHAWQKIIRENREAFAAHPEYLALGGKRGGHKFCVSNPALVGLCNQYAVGFLNENPDRDMVSLEPSDGVGHCKCPECRAIGPVPERVHYLVNEAGKTVTEKHPGKYVGTYAYSQHSEPPSFKMAPSVYVQITAGFTRGRYTFLELIEQWHKHVSQLGIYEYLNVWAWTRDMPGAARGANTEYLRERIPYYVAHGATTMSNESGSNFGANGLGYLVASRLMWNPEADVAAVCQDFYRRAFGPAAAAMQRYYERFDGRNKPMLSDHLMALAHRDVAEASDLATGQPGVLARLDDVKLYLYYVRLMRDLALSQGKEPRLEALFPVLNLAYRARHRYIVNSPAIRGRYQTYYLRGIKQPPEWDWRKTRGKTAWCTGDDYTHEEVERIFQQGLNRFKTQPVEERSFSNELVHAGLKPTPKARRAKLEFQGGEKFVMQSLGAEPLEFQLLTGRIAHYRNRRPTQWSVADASGKTVAQGELPLDGEWRPISVPVPQAGTYHFDIKDFGAGWGIKYEPGKPYVWQLEKAKRVHSMGWTFSLHFYVPKGTETVSYYVQGNAHTVVGANGQEIAKVPKQPGNLVSIPVPDGRDGEAWYLKNLGIGKLWFYNCPNYIAAGAEDLLVPRELLGR